MNSRWNSDELQLAVLGVRKYGKDFQAIAELLGTKTEGQVRTFFLNYRRKYSLDVILQEFEQNNHPKVNDDEQKPLNNTNSHAVLNKDGDDEVMEVSD